MDMSPMAPQKKHLILTLLLLFILPIPSLVGADDPNYDCGRFSGNFTAGSIYESNLNMLLPSLTSNVSALGFANATVGSMSDMVYGLVLCRGDTSPIQCRNCLNTAVESAPKLCPLNKAASIWYDECLLIYSNQNIFSSPNHAPVLYLPNASNVTEPERFGEHVRELMDRVCRWAAYNSSRRFATGEANFTATFPKIYGLAQCTLDLTEDQCNACLRETVASVALFAGKQGGKILGVKCIMRYDVYHFYHGSSILLLNDQGSDGGGDHSNANGSTQADGPAGAKGKKHNVKDMVLAICIPLVIVLPLILIVCNCIRRRRQPPVKQLPYHEASPEEIVNFESILLDLSVLKAATADFSVENKLGEGGFGVVYKGALAHGIEIAVKRLSRKSGRALDELKNELFLMVKLQHRNLVRLLGACMEEEEKLLVYEYVPNKSLDSILFDSAKSKQLNWRQRYKIIEGIARGLLYLHEESQLKVVHRDLKASNVLLDAEMKPKISDFGLARLFCAEQTQGSTTHVVGTFGYMAPEYAMHGHFSVKSDVFSFGVLVLEIVTGRKNNEVPSSGSGVDLLGYVWQHWKKGSIWEVLDSSVVNDGSRGEALRCIQIGLLCVQEDPAERPTMSKVALMLSSETVTLLEAPSRPPFVAWKAAMDPNVLVSGEVEQVSQASLPESLNDVSISELAPR